LPLQKSYLASVWYFDATDGASASDPDATRPGLSVSQSSGCSAEVLPQDGGVDPTSPMRATGSKRWKRLLLHYRCESGSLDSDPVKVCLYASRGRTGASVAYDELRLRPEKAQMSTFAYDLYGNLISSADANETVTHYEYDPFGNLTGIRNDDGVLLSGKAQQYGRMAK
jgi:YD repeat-containing protein